MRILAPSWLFIACCTMILQLAVIPCPVRAEQNRLRRRCN